MAKKKIDKMVDKFLAWNLPKDFAPDGGISFKGTPDARGYAPTWPTGTNLLNAEQAKDMIEQMLEECDTPDIVISTANFLRGMCFDPSLPTHIKKALQGRIAAMDNMVDEYSA
jgi:hypothetical protein